MAEARYAGARLLIPVFSAVVVLAACTTGDELLTPTGLPEATASSVSVASPTPLPTPVPTATTVPTVIPTPAPATPLSSATVVPEPPEASISVRGTSGAAPFLVEFSESSTGAIDSVAWDFGDGSTSTDLSPVHTYTLAGTYSVRLRVWGPNGTDEVVMTDLITVARRVTRHDATAWDDSALRSDVGHMQAELDALWAMVKLSVSQASTTGVPGIGASAMKLVYTELYQRLAELSVRVLGRAGIAWDDIDGLPSRDFLTRAIQSLSLTIAAGTSQIQRNIVAERILGLPKDR